MATAAVSHTAPDVASAADREAAAREGQRYMEELMRVEREMYNDLQVCEQRIADEEERYITELSSGGNALMGWDMIEGTRRDKKARLFSESSATWTHSRRSSEDTSRMTSLPAATTSAYNAGKAGMAMKSAKKLKKSAGTVSKAVSGKKRSRAELGLDEEGSDYASSIGEEFAKPEGYSLDAFAEGLDQGSGKMQFAGDDLSAGLEAASAGPKSQKKSKKSKLKGKAGWEEATVDDGTPMPDDI